MINGSNANYSFEDSGKWFGNTHRIKITMSSGKVYDVAAEVDSDKLYLPKCLRSLFWAKVTLADRDGHEREFLINRSSLAKRTGTSSSLSKFALKQHKKNFDAAMRILHTADKIAEGLEKDHSRQAKRIERAGKVVKTFEKNKVRFQAIGAVKGSFVERTKNHIFYVHVDPKDPNNTNFYFKQAKLLGKGSYKKVYPLMNYETQESSLALSIQKVNKENRNNMNLPFKGFKIMQHLRGSKNTMKAEFFQEDEIKRADDGSLVLADDNAVSYLVTKKYDGKFTRILKAENISQKNKLLLFAKILEGVAGMHERGIFHRDLKFENILYKIKNNIYKIKLIDFDLSLTFLEHIATQSHGGTMLYRAPETLARKIIQEPDKIDSWALGVLLYTLCEGKPDYFSKFGSDRQNWADIASKGARDLPFKNMNKNHSVRNVIEGLLHEDPAKRMSVADALAAINRYNNAV